MQILKKFEDITDYYISKFYSYHFLIKMKNSFCSVNSLDLKDEKHFLFNELINTKSFCAIGNKLFVIKLI